jgi:hypothetical protein
MRMGVGLAATVEGQWLGSPMRNGKAARMPRMTRPILLLALPALLLAGCLNWQGTYDVAARRDCQKLVDAAERQACLASVAENSQNKGRAARD